MINKIEVIRADITTLKVDAIVNAANNSLLGGGGVDGAIHRGAGKQLLEECRKLGGCATGDSKITKGYNLPAKYVIHTVGPVWHGEKQDEDQLLASCYNTALRLAVEYKIKTIAFPAISTGIYGFPFERAGKIAIEMITASLKRDESLQKVYLVCFSEDDFEALKRVLAGMI